MTCEDWSFSVIFSSGGHLVQWSVTILSILVQGHKRKKFCEVILKLIHLLERTGQFIFLFYFFTRLSSVGHLVQ